MSGSGPIIDGRELLGLVWKGVLASSNNDGGKGL